MRSKPYHMHKYITLWSFLLVCLLLIASTGSSYGQSGRKTLEKERSQIIKAIEQTSKKIQSTQSNKKSTLADLKAINAQINNRKKLISNIQKQLEDADAQIGNNAVKIDTLNSKLSNVRAQYLKVLKYSYLRDLTESKWMYIFSAKSLNESFLRWRYLKQFENYSLNKREEISSLTANISEKTSALEAEKKSVGQLLKDEKENYKKLEKDQKKKDQILKSLKKQESSLKTELAKRQKEREKLNLEIENIIIAELARKKKVKKTSTKTAAVSSAIVKRKLRWPVQGYVSSTFGDQAHPTIPSLKVTNNGIDITASSGSQVKAVADGEVIGVTKIPGYENMVIIQHGSYYSVYSKLAKVNVSKGNSVKGGKVIGNVQSDGVLHFELWKDKTKLNPSQWLQKK